MTAASPVIDSALVARLLGAQFPQWAGLPLAPADPQGWDNRSFRLGTTMVVRLPSAAGYAAQVEKEQRWLPFLAARLPLPIPAPLAVGVPGEGFPWQWSIYRWLGGETARVDRIGDLRVFAGELAAFLVALQQVDAAGGPPPGPHNFFRGAPLATYDGETRHALSLLADDLDAAAALRLWQAGIATAFNGAPVWLHGDVAVNNLLVHGGRLAAVIDFGCAAVGDPACDLAIAWTLFTGESRAAFQAALPLDAATWQRGAGWALWKALITLAEYRTTDHATDATKATDARRVLHELLHTNL